MADLHPKCDACDSPERDQIDLQLVRGVAIGVVAEAFRIPHETIDWHLLRHLTIPKKIRTSPHDLLQDLQFARLRAENVLNTALIDGKLNVALSAIKEMREAIMALAKLTHAEEALDPRFYLPLYEQIKVRILQAVEDHPEVRERIIGALSLEDKSNNGNV